MTDTPAVPTPEKCPDKWNLFAAERYGVPEGWRWGSLDCSPEVAPHGWVRVEGAVFVVDDKGSTWNQRDRRTERVLWMNLAELDAWWRTKAEGEDRCWKCWGSGQQSAGWSAKDGARFATCTECKGSGKPAVKQETAA